MVIDRIVTHDLQASLSVLAFVNWLINLHRDFEKSNVEPETVNESQKMNAHSRRVELQYLPYATPVLLPNKGTTWNHNHSLLFSEPEYIKTESSL